MELQADWYPAGAHDGYVEDRRHIAETPVDGEPIEILGRGALLWAYGATDHTAIREVENGHWFEVRGRGMDEAAYRDLLGRLRLVDREQFEAATSGTGHPDVVVPAGTGTPTPAGPDLVVPVR